MTEQILEKVCGDCKGDPQPLTNFYRNRGKKDGRTTICKSCAKVRATEWAAANPDRVRANVDKWNSENPERVTASKKRWKEKTGYDRSEVARAHCRESRARLRIEAITVLGGKCECCGEANPKFICFDHVGGWGASHRKVVSQSSLPGWLKKHHYPRGNEVCSECGETHGGVRLLCYDCNMSVAASPDGTCAHKESFEETRRKRIELNAGPKQQKMREWRWQLREGAIAALGGECYCCGQSDSRFLCFDHVDNWGREQRVEMKHAYFLSWLKQHGYPKGGETCANCGEVHQGVRLACFRCNMAAGKDEVAGCPHQEMALAA